MKQTQLTRASLMFTTFSVFTEPFVSTFLFFADDGS